jgi:hypothetical protein
MNRRSWFRSFVLALSWVPLVRLAFAEDPRVANLSETLRFALRCRRPVEFQFVALVVEKVEDKELPLDMVLSMLQYARKRRPSQPFPYFQAGMKKRAAAIGVEL